MGTTINPCINGSPFDDDGPEFPSLTGQGMGGTVRQLLESKRGKKSAKQIIKEAQGTLNRSKPKVKTGKKPENLRVSASKGKKKRGAFGEAYSPVAATAKGNRVSGK